MIAMGEKLPELTLDQVVKMINQHARENLNHIKKATSNT